MHNNGRLTSAERATKDASLEISTHVELTNLIGSTGAGRMARQMIEHLVTIPETSVSILTSQDSHASAIEALGRPWTDLPCVLTPHGRKSMQRRWWLAGAPLVEDLVDRVDVTYCPSEHYIPTRTSALVGTIFDAAQLESGVYPHSLRWRLTREKKLWLCRRLAKEAAVVHTLTNFAAERIAHFVPPLASRLKVIPLGVSPPFLQPPTEAARVALRDLGLADRRFVLVPGGLNERKNARLILEAWPKIDRRRPGEVELVVAGHSEAEFIARARAARGVTQLGYVDDDLLCALYHEATVVWFPSKYEGFGLPAVEAMACGAPLVVSDGTAVAEVVSGGAWRCGPAAIDNHIAAVIELVDDHHLRDELSTRGTARAAQFTWERAAQTMRDEMRIACLAHAAG